MVAFLTSVIIMVALTLLVIPVSKRRPPGTLLTWGEAMAAAVYAFFIMFWTYAVVPHLWLTWSSNELGWTPTKDWLGPWKVLQPQQAGGWFPLDLNYQVLRDIIVVGIYVLALGFQIWIFAWWQNRAKRQAEVPAVTTSDYGRPLVRKS